MVSTSKQRLLILGVHIASEGYPNTLYRLQGLQASGLFNLSEINISIWSKRPQNNRGAFRLIGAVARAFYAHSSVLIRYLTTKRPDILYVPYPAVFVLYLLSLLPPRFRPRRVLADGFISLYDTVINDRRLLSPKSLIARLLKNIEQRAYHFLDKLVVDTPQNARFLCALFELPESKVVAIPLSTDEVHFKHSPYQPQPKACRVLFVGTLVPLHGITTILEAARLLAERSDIQFKIIGDGQDAPIVEAWLQRYPLQLTWEKQWQSSPKIGQEIMEVDICLGIFGTGEKTQRVCPFKLYAYASVGRAIISGETEWLKNATEPLSYEAIANTPVGDATALAAKIAQLADDADARINLAINSNIFYKEYLGNQAALEKLITCLLED